MKNLKKVLVVLIAVMLVASMSAVAFADGGKLAVTADPVDEDGYIVVHVFAQGAVGMKSADYSLKYDPAVVAFEYNEDGADAAQVGDTKSNSFSSEANDEGGVIKCAFYFKTTLVSHDDFAADSKKKNNPVDINSDNFEVAVFYFSLADENAASATFEVTVTAGDLSGSDRGSGYRGSRD